LRECLKFWATGNLEERTNVKGIKLIKKVTVIVSLLGLTVNCAFALPPTEELPPLHIINIIEMKPVVDCLDQQKMISPIPIFSHQKMDIYIFENFVKWGNNKTGEFVFAPPVPLNYALFSQPILLNSGMRAGNFLKTGNFGVVLYYEFKDEALREQIANELKNKIRQRIEWEKQDQKYRDDIAMGKPGVHPSRLDMQNFLVTMPVAQTLDGIPVNVTSLKYLKTIVFFDMQHNKMISLKELYIDQNGQGIAWGEYQNEEDLNTHQMFKKIAKDIAAMFEQSSAVLKNAKKVRGQQLPKGRY
jgi:hypothetical protein